MWDTILENLSFIGVCLLFCTGIFLLAWALECRLLPKRTSAVSRARHVAVLGLCSALSAVLMLFEIPLFFAPSFYQLDLSELPVLICGFAMGPVAGVLCELLKVILKILLKGTSTAFVGDFANFLIGCTLVLPAATIYHYHKSRKTALIGLVLGSITMTVFGSALNAFYLIPQFSKLFGLPLDAIVGMGTAVNPAIHSLSTLVLFAVVPFNLLKSLILTILVMVLYKHIKRLLKI